MEDKGKNKKGDGKKTSTEGVDLRIDVAGKEYGIEIKETPPHGVTVKVEGEEFTFKEEGDKKEKIYVAKTSIPKRDFSEKEIRAPISGTISEIFVKEGMTINKNEKLILLSAMKMENEIVSDFKGRVKEIAVKKEQRVKEGETLVILD